MVTSILPASNRDKFPQATLQTVVFSIDEYTFALPMEAVAKIIPCPPLDSSRENGIGLVEWEGKIITIVDLQQKLASDLAPLNRDNNSKHPFLILTPTKTQELCGFITEQPPTLIDITLDDIFLVPLSYREVNQLSFVSHMALLTNPETQEKTKVFLLGIDFGSE